MEILFGHSLTDRQLIVLVAVLLSALVLGPLRFYTFVGLHKPARLARRFFEWSERKLNRDKRSAGKRVYRGIVLLLFALLMAVATGLLVNGVSLRWSWGICLEMLVLACAMPAYHLWHQTRRVSRAITQKNPKLAEQLASKLSRREHGELDSHSVARVSIEYLAEQFSDKVVAVIFWYMLLGLPGALVVRMVNLLDGQIGHKSKRYMAFGWATAKLDDLLQWIPARLSALLFCVAALFIPAGKPLLALTTTLRDASKTASPNSGWPIAAAAGALNVTLAGPRRTADTVVYDAWIGKGTPKTTVKHLLRAQWLYVVGILLLMLKLALSIFIVARMI